MARTLGKECFAAILPNVGEDLMRRRHLPCDSFLFDFSGHIADFLSQRVGSLNVAPVADRLSRALFGSRYNLPCAFAVLVRTVALPVKSLIHLLLIPVAETVSVEFLASAGGPRDHYHGERNS